MLASPFGVAYLALGLLMAIGAWFDLTRRILPNLLCLIIALAGCAISLGVGGLSGLGSATLHMLIALVVGMVLFKLRMIGGGDAKFYASVAAWFPMSLAGRLAVTVALTGLVLMLVWIAGKRLAGIPIMRRPESDKDKLPYGVAIGIGALLAYSRTVVPID